MEEKEGLWWKKVSSQVIFLNGTCTGEAQMEVSRRLQVIKMVVIKWGEETYLMETKNLNLVVEL